MPDDGEVDASHQRILSEATYGLVSARADYECEVWMTVPPLRWRAFAEFDTDYGVQNGDTGQRVHRVGLDMGYCWILNRFLQTPFNSIFFSWLLMIRRTRRGFCSLGYPNRGLVRTDVGPWLHGTGTREENRPCAGFSLRGIGCRATVGFWPISAPTPPLYSISFFRLLLAQKQP